MNCMAMHFFTTETPKEKQLCSILWSPGWGHECKKWPKNSNVSRDTSNSGLKLMSKCKVGFDLAPTKIKAHTNCKSRSTICTFYNTSIIKNSYVIHCDTMMYIPMCNVVMIVHRDMQLTGRVRYCMYVSWHCHWHWYWNLKSLMTSCLTSENLWNFWNKTKINNDVSCNR